MRQKLLKEIRNNLIELNMFSRQDINEIIHIININYKKIKADYKKYKRSKYNEY